MAAAAQRTSLRVSPECRETSPRCGGGCCREPGCPWLLRPQRSPARKTIVLHTLQGCAASPHGTHSRLGVGARWRNATTVKRDWGVDSVSGVSFLNKSLRESWVNSEDWLSGGLWGYCRQLCSIFIVWVINSGIPVSIRPNGRPKLGLLH